MQWSWSRKRRRASMLSVTLVLIGLELVVLINLLSILDVKIGRKEVVHGSQQSPDVYAIAGAKIDLLYNPRSKRFLVAANAESDMVQLAIESLVLVAAGVVTLLLRGKFGPGAKSNERESPTGP